MTRRVQSGAAQDTGVFKDWLKQSYGLTAATSSYQFPPELNDDQYPIVGGTLGTSLYRNVDIPGFHEWGVTELVLRWAGTMDGNVGTGLGAFLLIPFDLDSPTATSGSVLDIGSNVFFAGTDGRATFKLHDPGPGSRPTSFNFVFAGPGVFSITKVILCRVSDEADAWTPTTENMFTEEYKAIFTDLGIRTFRPLGWSNTNYSFESQFRYRHRWENGIGFTADRFQPSCWVGIISGTNTYTCGPSGDSTGSYVNGEVIQGFVTNANSTACTLNSDGRGAKPIRDISAGLLSGGEITAVALNTFVYSTILESWIARTSNAVNGLLCGIAGGAGGCWPLEVCVGFCNACDMNYWHQFPFFIDDASITEVTEYVRDNLNSGLSANFEYANEVWNPQFSQFHAARACGAALGFWDGEIPPAAASDAPRWTSWLGLRSRQIFGLVRTAWSPRTNNELLTSINLQMAGGTSDESVPVRYALLGQALTSEPTIPPLPVDDTTAGSTNTLYDTLIGVDYNTAPNRPIDFISNLAGAPYVGGNNFLQFSAWYVFSYAGGAGFHFDDLADAADDYDSGDPERMAAALLWADEDMKGNHTGDVTFGQFSKQGYYDNIYPGFVDLAERYSLTCRPYEGGWGFTPPSEADAVTIGLDSSYGGPLGKIGNLMIAYKLSEYAHDTMYDYMTEMVTAGLQEPSWLLLAGGAAEGGNPYGIWLNDPLDPATPRFKAWEAIYDFNFPASNRGFNTRLR